MPPRPPGSNDWPRWLSPEVCAAYISERIDHLPRLVREGKLPQPSDHLGPRRLRYDREAIDALFSDARATDVRREQAAIVERIITEARIKRKDRQQKAGRRLHPAIPLRPQTSD